MILRGLCAAAALLTLGTGMLAAQELRIAKALYGHDNRWMDVTEQLRRAERGERLDIVVSNQFFGSDPAPANPKTLRIEYYVNGRFVREEVPENARLFLPHGERRPGNGGAYEAPPPPPPPPAEEMRGGLRIIYAGYGARNRFSDVTRILRNLRSPDGSLHIKVNNTNMGGDPFIGADKILRIDFEIQGRKMHRELREGDFLNLP
ncbi:MAG TPA: hypothetical protein VGL53_30485 [Bryobacteraceae bacterium]|jgi:hypothetical protein